MLFFGYIVGLGNYHRWALNEYYEILLHCCTRTLTLKALFAESPVMEREKNGRISHSRRRAAAVVRPRVN